MEKSPCPPTFACGHALLEAVAQRSRLREGFEGVITLLRAIYRARDPDFAAIARAARLPLPVASAVRRELEREQILDRRHGATFTERGRRLAEDELQFTPFEKMDCPTCDGTGLVLPTVPIERLEEFLREEPPTDVTLDQAPCSAGTAVRRAALMYEAGALENRQILILGDDDSVSLALCLFFQSVAGELPRIPIVVLELDPKRIGFLRTIAIRESFPIEVIPHDLREPLPPGLANRFDVFETDPPYTIQGAELFLSRARAALRSEGGLGYLSFAQRPPVEQHELLQLLGRLGFAITAMHPQFNAYRGATILGNTGQLLELSAVPGDANAVGRWHGPLYSAEVNPRERHYRCKGCGKRFTLGVEGAPVTIEALKAVGCPKCRSTVFRRAPSQPNLPSSKASKGSAS